MQKNISIGVGQFFSLLLLCRLLTSLTFAPSINKGYGDKEWIAQVLFLSVILIVFAVPIFLLYRKDGGKNIIERSQELSSVYSRVLAFIYFLVFMFFTVATAARFDIFTTSVIFPDKNMTIHLIIAIFMCGYAAFLGLEAIARSGSIMLSIVLTGIAIVFVAVISKFDYINLEPIFYYPIKDTIKNSFVSAGKTSEIIMMLFLLPVTTGNVKKGFISFVAALTAILAAMFIVLSGVAGEFARTQLFPFYSLAILAEFSLLERLDSIVTAIWIFAMLIKNSLLIYLSGEMLCKALNTEKKIPVLLFICASVSALSLIFSRTLSSYSILSNGILSLVITLIAAVAIPLVTLAAEKIFPKRRKAV